MVESRALGADCILIIMAAFILMMILSGTGLIAKDWNRARFLIAEAQRDVARAAEHEASCGQPLCGGRKPGALYLRLLHTWKLT